MGHNIKFSPKLVGPYIMHKILPHNMSKIIGEKDLERRVVHWNHIKITSSHPWSVPEFENNMGPDTSGTPDSSIVNNDNSETCQYPLRNRVRL